MANMEEYLAYLEYLSYLKYLQPLWDYFPHMLLTYVVLTFLPKSLRNIRTFAAADYKANHKKFHRCYAPELCCHDLVEDDLPKQKPRKAVTRVYPKKHSLADATCGTQQSPTMIKRQVQPALIQTNTSVNKIAKMFENGGVNKSSKKINRVVPTILPEIRMQAAEDSEDDDRSILRNTKGSAAKLAQLLQENIENSANYMNGADTEFESSWRSQPMISKKADTLPRRTRTRPTLPNIITYAGTSATPSTVSPAASSSPQSSPISGTPPPASPIMRRAPLSLNLKSSLEDIFAAIAQNAESVEKDSFIYTGCNTLSPVKSIDDILSQRRLSRPLSAYSISDLLNEENAGVDELYVENYMRTMNKT